MLKATNILNCVQRLTSSFAGLRKPFSVASNQRWLTDFQRRPLPTSSRCLAQTTALKANIACNVRDLLGRPPQRSFCCKWPTLIMPEVSKMVPKPLAPIIPIRGMASLWQMHKTGPHHKKRKRRRPLDGNPFLKGVVLKTLIKKPKKPNSANRRCVLVRLSNGKEAVAHVPGEGHNLQEHNIVLVRVGRLQDVPGVRLKVVRGKYDCAPVIKKTMTA